MDLDIDKIELDIDWPIIARFKDDYFPYNGYDHIRYTARALIENRDGNFGFLHIVGEDFFGLRNHLETCGGGLEEKETLIDCIIREIHEEMGLEPLNITLLGSILDAYNLINRVTLSTFFHCYVDNRELKPVQRTKEEEILIKEIVWLESQKALEMLLNDSGSNVDKIVHRRDAAALKYYLENK